VIYDEVQYTRRDWRNRNKIKTPTGDLWLSIPVEVKNKYHQKISDAKISNHFWQKKHWLSIKTNYAAAPYFKLYSDFFEDLYLQSKYNYLVDVNYAFIYAICNILKINTKISSANEFAIGETERNKRLIDICKISAATHYYSGLSGKNYLNEQLFLEAGIEIKYIDYGLYQPYSQLHNKFSNNVSVLDLIFNAGPDAIFHLNNSLVQEVLPQQQSILL
jgi:hypothetical protein